MNTMKDPSWTLKMSVEGGTRGLMWIENVPCLKAQKYAPSWGTSVFAFLHHLNFMYTRSVVLSKYLDFQTEDWLQSCKALFNHSAAQSGLCHFMFACILTSSPLHVVLWQDREQASFLHFNLKLKTTHGHFSLLLVTWWYAAAQQTKARKFWKRQELASNMRAREWARQRANDRL